MRGIRIGKSITDRQDASLGIYFRDVSKLPLLNQEEEYKVAKKAKNGDRKALDRLITSNLRFVISVAKQYQGRGIPLVDLIQAGNQGLIEATKKFNPDKGYKFISFAVWWIRQAIIKSLSDQCRTIRVPTSQLLCINKINKATEKFEQENGRSPSTVELEHETKISSDRINYSMSSISRSVSLDSPLKDEDTSCLLDIIPNEDITPTDSNIHNEDRTREISRILDSIPYRDGDIVRMFFGIGMPAMPNDEIAKRFGIGNERVRQILRGAIKRLRRSYINKLKELL